MKDHLNHSRKVVVVKFLTLICLTLILVNAAFSQSTDAKLVALRNQFAVNYLKPEAHFALASYYLAKGDKLQAFYILEYARRYRFPQDEFDAAFVNYFGDNSPEPSDEAKDAFEKGYKFLEQKQIDEAEKLLVKAATLAPKSGFIQGWVGRFYYKVRLDNDTALKYYYNAYFLDPHAYETEFVESRISNLTSSAADLRFAELLRSGKSLVEISTDANPLIVMRAMEQMDQQWKKEYKNSLLECLSNDDSIVRWAAFETVFKYEKSSSDEMISMLSTSKDLRKKGLAAYAIIDFQKKNSFEILKKMLTDNAELIRFDALSAFALKGGQAGLEALREHRKFETNPKLKSLIDMTLSGKK